MSEWQGKIDSHFFDLSSRVAEKFGTSTSFFLILRPDNYIGMISDDFSPAAVETYLSRFS